MLQSLQERRRPKIFLLGNGKIDFDRIDLGHLGQDRGSSAGTDQIADLSLGHARDPIERRGDGAVVQIEFRCLDICLRCGHRSHPRLRIFISGVILLLTDHFGAIELRLAIEGYLRELGCGYCLGVIGLGLRKRSFKRPLVDCEKDIALLNQRTLFVILSGQIPSHLRADVSVSITIEKADPRILHRHVLLADRRDRHRRRRCDRRGSLLFTTNQNGNNQPRQQGEDAVHKSLRIRVREQCQWPEKATCFEHSNLNELPGIQQPFGIEGAFDRLMKGAILF